MKSQSDPHYIDNYNHPPDIPGDNIIIIFSNQEAS